MAKQFNEGNYTPDLIVATDMLDLATFQALTRKKTSHLPFVLYCHENQLTYPWSPTDQDRELKRDRHYGFINYTSCLAADEVWFNSRYHRTAFLEELPVFLKAFPDHQGLDSIDEIEAKSKVVPLGLELARFDQHRTERPVNGKPLILWNHRWEYDKNPDAFFGALKVVKELGFEFRLAALGERYKTVPASFEAAQVLFEDELVGWGYAESFELYAKWLWRADILPVTSNQDFFGISAVEAMYCNTFPLLPNRLAFPEHLPASIHTNHVYEAQEDLIAKLIESIQQVGALRSVDLQQHVQHYDWKACVASYDQLCDNMLS